MTVTLTPQEEADIIRAREQRRLNDAGAYGPPEHRDPKRNLLLADLQAWNDHAARQGYPSLPRDTDTTTLKNIKAAIEACRTAKDERGIHRPFHLPIGIAYLIMKAIER